MLRKRWEKFWQSEFPIIWQCRMIYFLNVKSKIVIHEHENLSLHRFRIKDWDVWLLHCFRVLRSGSNLSIHRFKGTVAWDFVLWFFSSIDPIWAHVYFTKFLSNSVSNSPSYSNSKFVLRCGPLRKTNFFCRYWGFTTWLV
jgi:hypothetical protein